MTTKKNLVKQVLMSTLTAVTFAFSFSSCSDEFDSPNASADNQQAPEGAKKELLEAYGLTFENFISENDIIIIDADTTQLSISKAYADKMGITSFVNHPMGIWHKVENLPYIRKATAEKLVGDRYIVDVVPATVAEIMGEKKVDLQTDIYVNNDASSVKTRAAGDNIPEYSAKYVDNNNVIHPAYIHLTDPYGYDTDYNTADDKPSAAQTRAAQSGEYQYITAEEIAGNQTRWGCHNRLIAFNDEMEKKFNLAVGKGSKDSVYMAFKSKMEFGLNYFLTLDGGVKWKGILPSPYLKKFEAGLDGNFAFEAEVALGFTKEWKLDDDDARVKIFTFKGYTFTFWVGPVPVAITTDPHLDVALDAKVSGTLETSLKYEYANSFKAGFGWADGKGFYGITDFKEEANELTFCPPQLKIHAEAGVGLYLVCDLKLYGLAGPKLGVGPRLGAELDGVCSLAEEKIGFKAKVGLSVNAVIGAKLEVLGYELADKQLTFPLMDEVPIWAYNWDLKEALHKSPKAEKEQKQVNNLKPKFEKVLAKMMDLSMTAYENYEDLLNVMMAMNGLTREQAEDAFLKRLFNDKKEYETSDDILRLMAGTNLLVLKYYNEMYPTYKAQMEARSWKEVSDILKQSPAYQKYDNYFYSTYKTHIDLELIRTHFMKTFGQAPANVPQHIEALTSYLKHYPMVLYYNTPAIQAKYGEGFLNNLISYGKMKNRWGLEQAEDAAYETVFMLYTRYDFDFNNWDWKSTDGVRLRMKYDAVLDYMAKNRY